MSKPAEDGILFVTDTHRVGLLLMAEAGVTNGAVITRLQDVIGQELTGRQFVVCPSLPWDLDMDEIKEHLLARGAINITRLLFPGWETHPSRHTDAVKLREIIRVERIKKYSGTKNPGRYTRDS